MRKTKPLQINIPEPCAQNWDNMDQNKQGRFCNHCQKTVIDFSQYSDAMLYQFISKSSGHVCGRFRAHQLDRKINIPPQPHSKLYRAFIGMGMTLLFVPISQQAKAQSYTPLAQEESPRVLPVEKAKPGKNTVQLKGRVLPDQNNYYVFAEVFIRQGNQIIAQAFTDSAGYFNLYLHPCTYDITVSSEGFIGATQENFIVKGGIVNELDFTLKANPEYRMVMGGMSISDYDYVEDSCSTAKNKK